MVKDRHTFTRENLTLDDWMIESAYRHGRAIQWPKHRFRAWSQSVVRGPALVAANVEVAKWLRGLMNGS